MGPVRSARISDLHIAPQFGKPAFAYSGVQTKMLPFIAEASLFDVSDSRAPGAYFRQPGRFAPYNLFANTKKLLAGRAQGDQGQGHRLHLRRRAGRGRGRSARRTPSNGPPRASPSPGPTAKKQWLIWQDGKKDMAAEGGQLGAPTIVIQYTKTERSEFHDFNQSYTPLVHTTGKGSAIVLRDGKAYKAKWERESEDGGTTFTTASGEPMNFAPGQVWVALASRKPVIP